MCVKRGAGDMQIRFSPFFERKSVIMLTKLEFAMVDKNAVPLPKYRAIAFSSDKPPGTGFG
jgi:hypothetical protein